MLHFIISAESNKEAGWAKIIFGRQNWGIVFDASNADVKLVGEADEDGFGGSFFGNLIFSENVNDRFGSFRIGN